MSSRKKKSKYCSDILLILFLKENRSPRRDISRAKNLTENERTRVLLRSRRRTYKHGRGHLVSQSCPSAVNVASTCLIHWSDLTETKKKKKKWNQWRKFFFNGRCIKKQNKKTKAHCKYIWLTVMKTAKSKNRDPAGKGCSELKAKHEASVKLG